MHMYEYKQTLSYGDDVKAIQIRVSRKVHGDGGSSSHVDFLDYDESKSYRDNVIRAFSNMVGGAESPKEFGTTYDKSWFKLNKMVYDFTDPEYFRVYKNMRDFKVNNNPETRNTRIVRVNRRPIIDIRYDKLELIEIDLDDERKSYRLVKIIIGEIINATNPHNSYTTLHQIDKVGFVANKFEDVAKLFN